MSIFKALLEQMGSEVADFHPFLNALFKKLPSVEAVYYTQGSNEMGADFIVYKRDDTLGQTDYIGVVAKLGAVKQDHSEVDRQIEECFVPRNAPDARGQIQLSEVWVAATGNISEQAKRKIVDKYRGRKVNFLTGEKLVQLADRYIPDYGRSVSIALANYRDSLLGALRELDARSTLVPGMELAYQFPDVQELRPDNHGLMKPVRSVGVLADLITLTSVRPFCLLESGMGGGKSRLLRELVRSILESEGFAKSEVIPVFATCDELAKRFKYDVDALVIDRTSSIESDLLPPSVVVLIDGFDELQDDLDRKREVLRTISTWARAQTGRSVLISTRPADELYGAWVDLHNVTVLRIRPLRGKKALALFSAVSGSVELSKRIQKDLLASPLVKSLDASPISYTLLARIIKENRQDIPASVPELFSKYFELVLGRWEIDKGLRKQVEFSVMYACLGEIANSLLENGRSEMSMHDVLRMIEEYARSRAIPLDANALLEGLANRSGVLFCDHSVGTVGFRHRAFAEFFYAQRARAAGAVHVTGRAFHPYWIGTYYFLAGLYKDCPDLISALTDVSLPDEPIRLMRIVNFGHILQAGYMTPRVNRPGFLGGSEP